MVHHVQDYKHTIHISQQYKTTIIVTKINTLQSYVIWTVSTDLYSNYHHFAIIHF